jgi:hypothetical protein
VVRLIRARCEEWWVGATGLGWRSLKRVQHYVSVTSLQKMGHLILKRASESRPSGTWGDDYDVLADSS